MEKPTTINEKMQWIKLYDYSPIKSKLADKYEVREWVGQKIGEDVLVPLLGKWDTFDEIDFNKLPQRFVLKATHGCGCNIIVKEKSSLDINEARKKFRTWMKTDYSYFTGELQYHDIKPRIIAEEYMENGNDDIYDYKVFCFNGEPQYIMFLKDRKQGLRMAFYDLEWNKQEFTYNYPRIDEKIEKPKEIEQIIEYSRKLCKDFLTVRIDFYILNDGTIRFGEMTFVSCGGFSKWYPPKYDDILGKKLKLPNE